MFSKGDSIAIDMPMTANAVVIYLAIVLSGMVVVYIADSFVAKEIATRLRVSKAKAVFTQVVSQPVFFFSSQPSRNDDIESQFCVQDFILRGGRKFPLYRYLINTPFLFFFLSFEGTDSKRSSIPFVLAVKLWKLRRVKRLFFRRSGTISAFV